jgi:hypothetical protein
LVVIENFEKEQWRPRVSVSNGWMDVKTQKKNHRPRSHEIATEQ